ncbi:dynein regulatory complex protein 8 isoform X2 [Lemur catta]|uniref:dynein regulatory complex protein 8 isoform X2 n=1 Tax=Lemur catta TaxID=9447 RepID=UPI001E26A538|nr:dynein regulatory complex protein 8 isoform X2 [Lemur catta]
MVQDHPKQMILFCRIIRSSVVAERYVTIPVWSPPFISSQTCHVISHHHEKKEATVAEFHKKIKEAFEVFDHDSNNTVDVREIGTIMRSLGCCPSEGELHDLIAEVEDEEPTGYIRYEKFLPLMTEILLERRFRPVPEDVLLRAFEVLDSAKRGFLTKEELIKYMTEEGEPFSQEEMEEMLSAAIDPDTNAIHYRDYITMMVTDES